MAGAVAEMATDQCGFCLEHEELKDPKILPCQHVHCLDCLKGNFDVNEIVQCPWCREVYVVSIDSLPSATVWIKSLTSCHVCVKRGNKDQSAVSYCTVCCKLFCLNHQQSHDDVLEEHRKLTIEEYRSQGQRLETRVCEEHEEFPYILGCKVCVKLLCIQCMRHPSLCSTGIDHQVINIDTLEHLLVLDGLNQLKTREDELSTLFKISSKALSDFDEETRDSVEVLARHKQTHDQTEFLANRSKTKSDLTRYMEEEVGTLWSNLSKSRMKIEAQLKQSHQVDVVHGHKETTDKIQNLLSVEIPKVDLFNVMTLEVKGEKSEVEVVSTSGISISLDQGMTICVPPKFCTLVRTVDASNECSSVCTYQGDIYVGLKSKGLDRVNKSSGVARLYINIDGSVNGIKECRGLIYALVYFTKDNWTMRVYNLSGTEISSWQHADNSNGFNKIAIINDKVVIPDRYNKQLTLYSLTGEVVQHIPCPLLSDGTTAICTADKNCVIISNWMCSQVFKLDLVTGRVIWTSEEVLEPQGVTCYKNRYVLVTNRTSETTIWVLDVRTGTLMSKLADHTSRDDSGVYDLHILGDTLVVPRYSEESVLFYQLT